MWLKFAKNMIKKSLRKNELRSDIHIAVPGRNEVFDDFQLYPLMNSFLQAATVRSLDIIGIVSDWLHPGQLARQIAEKTGIDIYVIPGQEIVSQDGLGVIALNISNEIPQRIEWQSIFKEIHNQGGFAVIMQPSARWVQRLNKIVDEEWAPEGIEVYSKRINTEYVDIDADFKYEFFMTSGSKTPSDLLESAINTKTPRSWWEKNGGLPKDYGKDFVPGYLNEFNENQTNQMIY